MKKKVKTVINEEKMKNIRYSTECENEELRKDAIQEKEKGDTYYERAVDKKLGGELKLSVSYFKLAQSRYVNAEMKYAQILASRYQTKEDEKNHKECRTKYLSCCDKIRRINKLIEGKILY